MNLLINEDNLEENMHYLNHDDYDDIYDSLLNNYTKSHSLVKAYAQANQENLDTAKDEIKGEDKEDVLEDIQGYTSAYFVNQNSFLYKALSAYDKANHIDFKKNISGYENAELSGEGPTENGFFFMHIDFTHHDNLTAELVPSPKSFIKWINQNVGIRN